MSKGRVKKFYNKRIEEGLCTRCLAVMPEERKGKHRCHNCKEKDAAESRKRRKGTGYHSSIKRRLNILKIDQKDYLKVFSVLESNPKCEICGVLYNCRNKDWCIDHCHYTNRFRGILCSSCNAMIGFAKDNCEVLRKAVEYLEKAASVKS